MLTNCTVGAKSSLMVYCFFLRKYPSVHVFFVSQAYQPIYFPNPIQNPKR